MRTGQPLFTTGRCPATLEEEWRSVAEQRAGEVLSLQRRRQSRGKKKLGRKGRAELCQHKDDESVGHASVLPGRDRIGMVP